MYIPNPAEDDVRSYPANHLVADRDDNSDSYRIVRTRGRFDWLLMLTVSGQGRCRLNGRDYLCEPGSVALLLPGTAQDYGTMPGKTWNFYWAHFIPRPAWFGWLSLPQVMPGLIVQRLDDDALQPHLHRVFERMIRENKQHSVYSDDLSQNALEEALLLIARAVAVGQGIGLDPRVEQVVAYMEAHLAEPISLDRLAQSVALSPSRLAHLYKRETGASPMQTLVRLRLRHAARLLAFSAHPIGAIAAMVGYDSPFHFSRQFKLVYGVSPKQYRHTQDERS
ncbi:MAG: AraC family transcriptional regulator [Chloroflexota bacterium]|nr:AraC family transcriptional regulator [Chloroflexota bacterium]